MKRPMFPIGIGQTFAAAGDAGPVECVALPVADYRRLLVSAEADADIDWCEECRAPLFVEEPARASTDEFVGCWYAATGDERYAGECVRYRSIARDPAGHD